jgi:hypothetical protein
MDRFFNTAGPTKTDINYLVANLYISSFDRVDYEEIEMLIHSQRYFVLHAPRQTGKTSALLEIMDRINSEGVYNCVYANIEAAQALRGDISLDKQISEVLSYWAENSSKPCILFLDKLQEPRARRVVAPILANKTSENLYLNDRDLEYVSDLGLITRRPTIKISNKIYQETIPRELTIAKQQSIMNQDVLWYKRDDI